MNLLEHVAKALGLVVLLIAGQQGAVVHELGHFASRRTPDVSTASAQALEAACALCPSFAHAATPAFTHSLLLPGLARTGMERRAEVRIVTARADLPAHRSRGPPFAS